MNAIPQKIIGDSRKTVESKLQIVKRTITKTSFSACTDCPIVKAIEKIRYMEQISGHNWELVEIHSRLWPGAKND